MTHAHERRNAALREVSNADRVYRSAFRELTSAGDFTPSSFSSLLEAVRRLGEAVRHLEDVERQETP